MNIKITPHHNDNPTRLRTFTVKLYNHSIHTTVTSTPAIAREWVYSLRYRHRHLLYNGSLVIGLGVQWRPTINPEAATLQLCVGPDTCLIFQLSHAPSIPATLRKLLLDDRITFVGIHNGRDRRLLQECEHELGVATLVDLAKECKGYPSMEEMASRFLGMNDVVKPREVGLSDWEEFWLSDEQVEYACVDAVVAFLLAEPLGFPVSDDDDDDDMEVDSDDDQESDYDYY